MVVQRLRRFEKKADNYLPKKCVDILDSNNYQMKMVETSLVVAMDNQNNYVCTWAHGGEITMGKGCPVSCSIQEQGEALALAKWEKLRKRKGGKTQRKKYAQGNKKGGKKKKDEKVKV